MAERETRDGVPGTGIAVASVKWHTYQGVEQAVGSRYWCAAADLETLVNQGMAVTVDDLVQKEPKPPPAIDPAKRR